jgi:hypothetical protein
MWPCSRRDYTKFIDQRHEFRDLGEYLLSNSVQFALPAYNSWHKLNAMRQELLMKYSYAQVARGRPREIRFRITNINPNNPISMELLGPGSGVVVVVVITCSCDRTPPVNLYPQLPRPWEESYENLRLAYSFHPTVSERIDSTRNPTLVSLNSPERT